MNNNLNINLRDIFGLITSIYLFSDFVFDINPKITMYKMSIYLVIDIFDILFIRPYFRYKYDILIHHLNILSLCYCVNNLGYSNYDKYFVIQEFTTIIIFLKNLIKYDSINNILSNILKISWIPIRLIIPLIPIYYKYTLSETNNIYFKVLMYNVIISYLLNIKWTLDFSRSYNNTYHFSSLFLFNFIFFMKKNNFWFITGFILTCISFIHHSLKNRITKSLDASLITFINFKMINDNISILKNISCGFIGLIIKYIYPNSELHSIIYTFTIIKCLIYSNYFYLLNLLTLGFGFYMFKIKNNATIWHLSNSIAIINYMYINDLIEEKFLNFS